MVFLDLSGEIIVWLVFCCLTLLDALLVVAYWLVRNWLCFLRCLFDLLVFIDLCSELIDFLYWFIKQIPEPLKYNQLQHLDNFALVHQWLASLILVWIFCSVSSRKTKKPGLLFLGQFQSQKGRRSKHKTSKHICVQPKRANHPKQKLCKIEKTNDTKHHGSIITKFLTCMGPTVVSLSKNPPGSRLSHLAVSACRLAERSIGAWVSGLSGLAMGDFFWEKTKRVGRSRFCRVGFLNVCIKKSRNT